MHPMHPKAYPNNHRYHHLHHPSILGIIVPRLTITTTINVLIITTFSTITIIIIIITHLRHHGQRFKVMAMLRITIARTLS